MRAGLNRQWLECIWAHSIQPYVEEQFFEPDRVEEFTLAAIEGRVSGVPTRRPDLKEEVDGGDVPQADPATGVEPD